MKFSKNLFLLIFLVLDGPGKINFLRNWRGYLNPQWSGWTKVWNLIDPEYYFVGPFQHEPSKEVIWSVWFRGKWNDNAIQAAREASEILLPKRHLWLLHSTGSASFILFAGTHDLIKNYDSRYEFVVNAKRIAARTLLVFYRATAVQRGILLPEIINLAVINPPERPSKVISELTTSPSKWGKGEFLPDCSEDGQLHGEEGWVEWDDPYYVGAIRSLWVSYHTDPFVDEQDQVVRAIRELEYKYTKRKRR